MKAENAKRILTIAVLLAGSFCAVSAMTSAAAENQVICNQVELLQDPTAREFYKSQIVKIKAAAASQFGELETKTMAFVTKSGERVEVDQVTFECISCHDGINASYHGFRFKSDNQTVSSAATISGGHPIGSHYGAAAYSRPGLKAFDQLHEDIVLVDGRVGCLSCHNPLNPEGKHLVQAEDICFACHSK